MPDRGSPGPLLLAIDPRSEDYDPDDDRWRDQVTSLVAALHAEVDVARAPRSAADAQDSKGAVEEIVISLGSAGTFTAAIQCLQAWLGRDRARRMEIRWDDGAGERHVTLVGEPLDVDSVHILARAAAERVGGTGWQAATGRS